MKARNPRRGFFGVRQTRLPIRFRAALLDNTLCGVATGVSTVWRAAGFGAYGHQGAIRCGVGDRVAFCLGVGNGTGMASGAIETHPRPQPRWRVGGRCRMIRTKRVYQPPSEADGFRVLVDRLWPRGISKERAALDLWLKEVAPSPALRRWFGHDPTRWEEFRRRYRDELRQNAGALTPIKEQLSHGNVTLVYAARDEAHNGARVLKELLEENGSG